MLTEDEKAMVRTARSVIRDMAHDWPTKELLMAPGEVCRQLSLMLGEKYNFDTGDEENS